MTTHGLIQEAISGLDDESVEVKYRLGARAFLSSLERLVADRQVHEDSIRGLPELHEVAVQVSVTIDGPLDDTDVDKRLEEHLSRTDLNLASGVPVPREDISVAPDQSWRRLAGLARLQAQMICATWLNTMPMPGVN